ncbi:MAG TPA: site-specific integrase, partial [Polyangiaceae bacterium]
MRKATHVFTRANLSKLGEGWYSSLALTGFTLRVLEDGSRYYACRYTVRGKPRRHYATLGRHGTITYQQAERKAKELLASATLGEDPRPKATTTTWDAWSKKYFERGAWKSPEQQERYLGLGPETESTRGAARNPVFRKIAARWANRTLDSFTVEDIEQAREDVREYGRIGANRWLACIAATFNAAVKSELLGRNPCVNVKSDRENPGRRRVLSPDEMKSLLAAAYADANVYARAAVLLLAMTGARSGEILAAEWEHVDLEARMIRLADSKSGRARLIPLPALAVELLKALPHFGKYVIAGAKADVAKPDLKSVWRRIAARAGLEGVNPHDVRRSYGLEVSRLAGVHVASKALGHESIAITEASYTPENFAAILDATDKRAALMPMPA